MTFIDNGIFGFDISTYQDAPTTPQVVDFYKMRNYGASFVIMRAGQGNFIDQDWVTHKNNSRGVLPRAPYWFYDPIREPNAQADLLLSAIGSENFEGRVWLDLEFYWDGAYSAPVHWRTFRNRIKNAGLRFGIYTRKTWYDGRVTAAEASDFARDPFWVAQYSSVLNYIPEGVVDPMMWQDGTPSIGIAAGVESKEIDHDKWNSKFNFNAEWGVQPPPPPPPGAFMKYKVLWTNVARRSAPTTVASSTTATPYPQGAIVDVAQDNISDNTYPTDPNRKWVKFPDGLYGASDYPTSLGVPAKRMEKINDPAPVVFPDPIYLRIGLEEKKYALVP